MQPLIALCAGEMLIHNNCVLFDNIIVHCWKCASQCAAEIRLKRRKPKLLEFTTCLINLPNHQDHGLHLGLQYYLLSLANLALKGQGFKRYVVFLLVIVFEIVNCTNFFGRDTSSKELGDFLRHTFSIFSNGLDRELYCQEEELTVR